MMRAVAAFSTLLVISCSGSPGSSTSEANATAQPILNGGFESSFTSWTTSGTTAISTIAHSGSASAKLGNTSSSSLSSVAQTFTAPTGSGALTFWYQPRCNDTVTYAWATATLKDNTAGTTATLLGKTCTNSTSWTQVSSSPLTAGHSYTITLTNQGDVYSSDYNYTYYDDVSVAVSGGTSDFSISVAPASASVQAGSTVSYTVSTAVTSGSAESVSLGVSGLPSGVTGSFSPSSVTSGGSSTLTLTAAASAAATTASFTVTGTAASGSHAASASVTVTASTGGSDFTLAISPTSQTTTVGNAVSYTISTTVSAGSSETVSLSVSGLPSGVSGSFGSSSIASGQNTTLTLTPSATASGTFTVTGTASSGSHAATASITVTAAANDFSVSLSPTSGSVTQGSSVQFTVSTATTSGSSQSVSLSVSGLPGGVTGSFSPASVTSGGSSTLTLTASSSATTGTASFSVTGSATSGSHSASGSLTVNAASSGVGIGGGSVDHLYFAVIGDTRPANIDSTSTYPTAIITKIYQDIQAMNPRPQFVVSTGDYMYSNTSSGTAQPQATLYENARSNYSGVEFPAMGNHECDGYTADNCTSLTQTDNIKAFMSTFMAPINQSLPYYSIPINATDGSWTAKLVVVACNYWNSTQQSWLTTQLGKSTTYTILARHEPKSATTGPCVSSAESIMSAHPFDLSLVGHSHTFTASSSSKEVVVGNGGAPLASSANGIYGYATVERLASSWQVKEYDYSTGLAVNTYTVP